MYPCMTKKENTTERITALHTLTHVYAKLHFAASAPWPASLRAQAPLEAHERVQEASKTKGRVTIEPVLPVDILGAYVLLPPL